MDLSTLKNKSFIDFCDSPKFTACSDTWPDVSLVCEVLGDHYADYKLTSWWTDCSDWHKLSLGNNTCLRGVLKGMTLDSPRNIPEMKKEETWP